MPKFWSPFALAALLAIAPMVQGASPMPTLVGNPAPAFSLPSDRGDTIRLEDYQGKQNVLLAFFPKAFTPG